MVQCQTLTRVAVLGRLRLASSQCFSWAVLALMKLVPLSRADILKLAVQEGIRPTGVAELHDLVLEEAAVLVGRVQGRAVLDLGRVPVAFADKYIRVLATWYQEHVSDADSLGTLPELVRTMDSSSRSPRDHHQWLSLPIRCLSSIRHLCTLSRGRLSL